VAYTPDPFPTQLVVPSLLGLEPQLQADLQARYLGQLLLFFEVL
jgi:hypothetical protein